MKLLYKLFLIILFISIALIVQAQQKDNDTIKVTIGVNIDENSGEDPKEVELSEDKLIALIDDRPSFPVFKDFFITTGIPLNTAINKNTADAMIQISIRQRLTRSMLPFKTFLYLTYTQKSFWDIYAKSSPFKDNNYNPGIGFGKYVIIKNKVVGGAFVQLEHESNGRDSIQSRSWNYLSVSAKYFILPRLSLGIKLWLPYVDGKENKDLLDYRGLGYVSESFLSPHSRWNLTAEINPRRGWGNINTTFTAAYRMGRKVNHYIYVRFYNGKGDIMLEYSKYEMNIRVGICIKLDFFNIF